MRKKILKSKFIHVSLGNNASEISCDVDIAHAQDIKNENGIKCTGIWDTGSEGCLISETLATKLKLTQIGIKRVIGVNIERISPEYVLNIFLPNGASFEVISALVGENIAEDEILLGMNIINKGDFAITNANQSTSMSYRTPSVVRINFENEYKKAVIEEEAFERRQNKKTKATKRNRKRRRPR